MWEGCQHSLLGALRVCWGLNFGFSSCTALYCRVTAPGRDAAYIIITHPLSSIYAWFLMSTTGYTWPVWSAPYDLLSGWSSGQDPGSLGPVIPPGLHVQWHTIKDIGPNRKWVSLGHHRPGLHRMARG